MICVTAPNQKYNLSYLHTSNSISVEMTKLTSRCPKDSTEGKTCDRMCHSPVTNTEKAEHALMGVDNTSGEKKGAILPVQVQF